MTIFKHMNPSRRRGARSVAAVVALAILTACGREESPTAQTPATGPQAAPRQQQSFLYRQPVGAPVEGRPWVTHVNVVDLDGDGRMDILATESQANLVLWLRQAGPRRFEEIVLATDMSAPVHVEAYDIDLDGDLDLLVACMGQVFPNNDLIGSVVILENLGDQTFRRRDIITGIARVTDVRAADIDGDGLPDLVVGQFGYDQGEIRWMRNRGEWQFDSEILLSLSGTINVCIDDFNGDGRPDFVALVSQEWEEIRLFINQGGGKFKNKVIGGSTNTDYGSSGIVLCDVNQDGRNDILYTNGDGFDYASPGPRPWHGVQWLENLGNTEFRTHRLGNFPGAYAPVGIDIDSDGDIDIIAVSAFNDWSRPRAESMVMWRNDGAQNFTRVALQTEPTHLVTAVGAKMDGDVPAIVTGGFHAYPPYDRMSRITVWWPQKQ